MDRERFVETYSQGVTNVRKIIVDTETGVNYLLIASVYKGIHIKTTKNGLPTY